MILNDPANNTHALQSNKTLRAFQNKLVETACGLIPEDWCVKRIGDLCQIFGRIGFRGYTKADIVEEAQGVLSISPSNISHGRVNELNGTYITWEKYHESPEIKIYEGDVLLVKTGSTFGKVGLVKELSKEATLNPQVVVFKDIKCPSALLSYVMQYDLVQNKITETVVGGAIPTLSQKMVSSFLVPLPNDVFEQTAIANALSDVDALIQELEKLIAKKQAIKTATMQQLLTGRTRLPPFGFEKGAHHPDGRKKGYKPSELGEIPEDWEVYPLGNLVKSTQLGGNYKNTEQDSVHPLIKMGNLGRGHIKLDKLEFIVGIAKQIDRLNYGDLLFNTRNTLELVGKVSVWRNELPEAYFNSNLMRICFKNELVGSNFYMNAVMNSESFVNDLSNIATGTTSVAAIYSRDLLQLRIALPQPFEQTAIAEVLTNMDDEIQTLEQRLNKTRQIKQGMMQELLTGKTRLVNA